MSNATPATADTIEPPAKSLGPVKWVGYLGIVAGALLIIVGIVAWVLVTNQLKAENITVPDDAAAFQGQQVSGPLTAYVQADIINHHALEATGGQTYAELPQDSELRPVAMQASFLRASLFTSVVAYGVSLFAAAIGVLSILFGWAFIRVANSPVVVKRSAVATS